MGCAPEDVLRFDTNTSPLPPGWLPEALRGPFDPTLNEYPDSSYAELTAAAAAYVGVDPHEVIVGAGADEVLDLVAKAYLPAGGRSHRADPHLRDVRRADVASERRGSCPCRGLGRRRASPWTCLHCIWRWLPRGRVVWLCSPNNPTGAEEACGHAGRHHCGRGGTEAELPLVVVDEAYFEFVGRSVVRLAPPVPEPARRPHHVEGVRPARPQGRLRRRQSVGDRSAGARPATGMHLDGVRARRRRCAAEPGLRAGKRPQSVCRAGLARAAAQRRRLGRLAKRHQLSAGANRRSDAAEAAAERLLRNGIVPRTFGPANPLRGHLRLTVRSRPENERLLAAIRSL